jgi:hypothetical protein
MSNLLESVRAVLHDAASVYSGSPGEPAVRATLARLDEPLRVAVAGKVKAGKSTLLNALIGEELATTDAGECTRIVTWYRDGVTYRVLLKPLEGVEHQVPFSRDDGSIQIDLGGVGADDVERLTVEWPSSSLREMTLIDTPGLASLSSDISQRTHAFLTPDDDRETQADAVLYLMRHLHNSDIRFLESFHDESVAQATPINAVGVLSRADEIGVGRIDAMTSARRIAWRYRYDPKVRRLCQTVVPVAGLLAQSGSTLREDEFRALASIAQAARSDVDDLLLSADRFVNAETPIPLVQVEREALLDRLGLFGIRLSVALIRQGAAANASALAVELVARSGLDELRQVLFTQFAARRDVLKARAALLSLESLIREMPTPHSMRLEGDAERIWSGAHEFAEIRLLNALRTGTIPFKADEMTDAERLLGGAGPSIAARLGVPPSTPAAQLVPVVQAALTKWKRRAENPMSTREVADAGRVLVRTCEGMLVALR